MSAASTTGGTDLLVGGRPDRDVPRTGRALPLRFLRSELSIIFGRRRNVALLAVLAAIPVLLAVAIKLSSDGDQGGGGPGFFEAITSNGLFVAFAALAAELPLFLPLAVAAASGDAIAGEANQGTLRYLLTIPAGRTRLLLTKYAAVVIFGLVATALVALAGVVAGLALFGGGDVVLLSGTTTSLLDGVGRLALSVLYLSACFAALGAIGMFVSTLTEQPIAAIVATIGVNVLMFILDQIPQISWLHPFLLVDHWAAFGDLLRDPMATDAIGQGLLVALAYAAVFMTAAWARFGSKDITS
ncbi:ABC-2 type transport system permease protein [Microlunatus sagamiharensis]|uniref:ABC-2 type transport system permease protein n=1 Tax=Microlunatus sagamiharensis TaxID=546874 RepID=A0A1H2LIR6_9ACTN|nr:ABC transporter permease subunit [Microlunatus sagamiharensis]SDU80286.1 ABC-2 type transport system permease protein [Microlunatus sagamiharensis]